MKYIDLSQTIVNRMQVYPGDEPPMLYQTHLLDFDGYTNFHLTIGMHAGTHIDGPWHMVGTKKLICEIDIKQYIGKACVIDISKTRIFNDDKLVLEKVKGYDIVLFYTGFGACFGTPQYLKDYPLISDRVANALVESGIKIAGIDTLSPDVFPHSIHKILLGNGILMMENLTNLDLLLPYDDITVIALPLKINADSAPARVIAMVSDENKMST
jgi:kynurenine formamidase